MAAERFPSPDRGSPWGAGALAAPSWPWQVVGRGLSKQERTPLFSLGHGEWGWGISGDGTVPLLQSISTLHCPSKLRFWNLFGLSTLYLRPNGARDARQIYPGFLWSACIFWLLFFLTPFLLVVIIWLVKFYLLSFGTAWSSLCMLCIYITLFLSLIMSLAFRVINNGKVSRKVFLELLHFLLVWNCLFCFADPMGQLSMAFCKGYLSKLFWKSFPP